jgi:23S rRNA (adenine2030-N6)-methyltransferase
MRRYLEIVRGAGRYPGSPLIAAKLLREQDRLVAIEKHPEDFRTLAAALAPFRRARAVEADGYARLNALLPPPERRGLILIDPPFEAPDEFAQAARAVGGALRRFETGIVVVWFPVKSPAAAEAFCGEVLAFAPRKALRLDVTVDASTERLGAAGLLVLNPPYGFAQDMADTLGQVIPRLGREGVGRFETRWLAGEE